MSNIFVRLLLNTDKFDQGLLKAQKSMKGFAATTQGVFGGLSKFAGYAGAFVGISTSIHSAVTANMEFEKSLSSLRSLTGVSADELNYFRAEAIRMGMDSTQSAKQMVDAFKLIGSQKPELLKNKTALTQTAEAAVVLAEAAELDVPTAAKALTGALNQMGASSAEATDYINILAAASQQGSADIPYLNKAIENAGGAASSTGVKFNELVAIIEAIAPKITDAASAGTNLRNIFLTLESSTDQNLRPSVVGLSKAIDNLAKKNMDAVQLTKMFGKESVTAAIAILQEKDTFDKLAESIQGTNTAYDQAEINSNNLSGSIGKLQSAWTSFVNTLSGSNGILKTVVDDLRTVVNLATRAMMTAEEGRKYDLNKKYGADAKAVLTNSKEWIEQDIQLTGKDRKKAIEDEMQALGRMYPLAIKYEEILSQYDKEKASYEEAWTAEKALSLNAAERQLNAAERQKYIYEYVLQNLKDQVSAIEDKAKAEEEAAEAAKAAKAAEAAKQDWINSSNASFWAKQKMTDRGKFGQSALPIVELGVEINEEDIEEELPKDPLELKLKAKLVDLEYAKGQIEQLKSLMEVATPEEQSVLRERMKEYENYVGGSIKNNQDYAESFMQISSAVNMMSGAFQGNAASIGQWALASVGQIAQMISQLQSLAMAQAATNAFKLPPPASFVAAATAIATVASIFASIPKFEQGGIVGGNSYFGDKLLARVNSGEMILNKRQQAAMFNLTEGGGTEITLGVSRIQGADLYLALSNYMKKTGKKL